MRVLITGSAGFVASHMVEHFLENTDWDIVGLDSFRHRGDSLRVTPGMDPKRYTVHTCDLSAPISYRLAEKIGPVDYIVNAASLSHVETSIEDPRPFVENNIGLGLSMLDYALRLVHLDSQTGRSQRLRAFVQISTDEVYGAAPLGVRYKEWDRLLPSNPYSASKAAQEALCVAYWRTYGVPVIITNTMNIIGERQDPEKFVPMLISRIHREEQVVIHGSEERPGSRFYLHARNQADAILWLLRTVEPARYEETPSEIRRPSRYNVVGDVEINNLELAQLVAKIMGKPLKYRFQDFHLTRPGHDRRYALDGSKLRNAGWRAPVEFEESLRRTIKWTLAHPEWMC
jgi:dTDP-glucose 4,6-dehydratase